MIIRPYRQTDRRVRFRGSRGGERSPHSRPLNRLFSWFHQGRIRGVRYPAGTGKAKNAGPTQSRSAARSALPPVGATPCGCPKTGQARGLAPTSLCSSPQRQAPLRWPWQKTPWGLLIGKLRFLLSCVSCAFPPLSFRLLSFLSAEVKLSVLSSPTGTGFAFGPFTQP